jgi:hypothetical protein
MNKETKIGYVGPDSGGLYVKEAHGRFYWIIEEGDCDDWEEIDEELYKSLHKHEKKRITTNE